MSADLDALRAGEITPALYAKRVAERHSTRVEFKSVRAAKPSPAIAERIAELETELAILRREFARGRAQ